MPAVTSAIAASTARITAFDFGASDERDHGLAEVEPRLRHPDQLDGLRRGHRGRQGGRVGQPDVLARQDDQPAGDEARVLAGSDHPSQVVQRRIDVASPDRLDEGADHVVVLVALPVVADRCPVDGELEQLERDDVLALAVALPTPRPRGR